VALSLTGLGICLSWEDYNFNPVSVLGFFAFFGEGWRTGLGLELSASGATPFEPLPQFFFVLGIFEIGSHELFPLTGLKMRSS
jgi:hypothetical protein